MAQNNPIGPLAFDPESPAVMIVDDGSSRTSPVLSGTPTYAGPISILFSKPVAGVAIKGGYFNNIGSVTMEAYKADGTVLGRITNSALGFEFMGFTDTNAGNLISGVSLYISGNEPFGFEIDNVTFGSVGAVLYNAPEPSSLMLLGVGVVGLVAYRRKSKRTI